MAAKKRCECIRHGLPAPKSARLSYRNEQKLRQFRVPGDRVESILVREILAWKPANAGSCDLAALMTHLTRKVNEPLSEPQVRSALIWLSARGLVASRELSFA